MAADDEPNLELPSLFKRRRRRSGATEPSPEPPPETPPPARVLRPTDAAKRRPPTRPPIARPGPADQIASGPTPRGPDMTYQPSAPADPAPTAPAPTDPEPTAALPPSPVLTEPASQSEPAADLGGQVVPAPAAKDRARRTTPAMPHLPARVSAVLTGLLVALAGIVLTWLILQGCTAVRGVSSCSGGTGLLGVLVVVVSQALLGTVLLRLLGVARPGSTAVLGVGLLSCIALVLAYAAVPTVALSLLLLLGGPAAYLLAVAVTGSSFVLRD